MKLFHFTSRFHLSFIEKDGFLKLVESNVSFYYERRGPPVVWLTTDSEPQQEWQRGSPVNKGEVRLTVEAEPVFWWPDWSREHGIEDFWYNALDAAGGGRSTSWYVSEEPIYAKDWIDISFPLD